MGEHPDGDQYRSARQWLAIVLIALVGVAVVTAVQNGRPVDMPAVIALLATAAGFLSVDLPSIRGPRE